METKLCRVCGKLTDDYVNVFKTEGLKVKLETCLPIVISKYSLLPDTTCKSCVNHVESFYNFIKNCLQSIIILETQFDVHDSCLKSKRKVDKGTTAAAVTRNVSVQTEAEVTPNVLSDGFANIVRSIEEAERTLNEGRSHVDVHSDVVKSVPCLVGYEISDDSNQSSSPKVEDDTRPNQVDFLHSFLVNKQYFDNRENKLVNEIAEKLNGKRKRDEIQTYRAKIFKYDANNRRKSRVPKRIRVSSDSDRHDDVNGRDVFPAKLPQVCLLCERQFESAALLATHVFDTHGIDMAQVIASETPIERKKKLPDLVKITDLKSGKNDISKDLTDISEESQSNLLCALCSLAFPNQPDLYAHIQAAHAHESHPTCGLCSQVCTSYTTLASHLEVCRGVHVIRGRYICSVCYFSDDSIKAVENHVVSHENLLDHCKKTCTIFDPSNYVETNNSSTMGNASPPKLYSCGECDKEAAASFESFREFSAHRRCQHQIFHCDLCNKFYGRNSHLWKHVNRVHKGHPSITCLFCNKTSASKYHLAQHFNKIHSAKSNLDDTDFLKKKFEPFDFQSVKQSFLKQELLEREDIVNSQSDNSDCDEEAEGNEDLPKEVDITSNLYTNIITNYTPPKNEGEYKCSKCFRGFLRKNVLKKHKKNCRPKNQKDLLTRCKTCTRIFKDRQSLAKHLINYHTDYECEICQQKFQSKCEIVSHIRFNHPKCHLFCYCGNILRNSSELNTHKKDHRNSFICHFCGDNLPTKIKLKMHILSLHRKILSLSCGICLKLFETQHILRDHVRLAHKERLKPLTSCTVCGKNYGSKWKTFDHLNKSHGRIFRPCRICLEVFNTENDLQCHYDSFHTENPHTKKASAARASDNDNHESINEMSPSGGEEDEENGETKVSLLEKRLVAGVKKEKRAAGEDAVRNAEEAMQNTSKRTVYVNSDAPSRCEICLKTWPAKKHLWQHYIRCHKSVAATVCGICLQANDSYATLQTHLRETHPTLLHGQGFGSNFICRICGRYHNASSKLKLHMAIHENFDWKILDEFEGREKNGDEEDDEAVAVDGVKLKIEEVEEEEADAGGGDLATEINYENLIEEVECSSESEEEEEEEEEEEKSESGSSSDDSDEEEASEENSLESQMLQNMLEEKGLMRTNIYMSQRGAEAGSQQQRPIKVEATSESEGEETTNSSYKAAVKSEASSAEDYQMFSDEASDDSRPLKTEEELNSAVRSICYEQVTREDVGQTRDYSDVVSAPTVLNSREIQTAVDSIL